MHFCIFTIVNLKLFKAFFYIFLCIYFFRRRCPTDDVRHRKWVQRIQSIFEEYLINILRILYDIIYYSNIILCDIILIQLGMLSRMSWRTLHVILKLFLNILEHLESDKKSSRKEDLNHGGNTQIGTGRFYISKTLKIISHKECIFHPNSIQ